MPEPSTISASLRPPVLILGVPFDNLTMAQTIEAIESMIRSRKPHYLVTANLDFLAQATRDVELRRILLDAHMVVCDGTPPLWVSRVLTNPLAERVAGADLVPRLIHRAEERGHRVFFLGATPASAREAVRRLRRQHPRLEVDFYSPPFKGLLEMDHDEIRRRISEARPDMLFVCFGCPKQEKWIWMHYRQLGVPVCVGVGATLDFLSGQFRRAPVWMRKWGLEWVHRLAQEPRRLFRRYVSDAVAFSTGFLRQLQCLGAAERSMRFAPLVLEREMRQTMDLVRLRGDLSMGAVQGPLSRFEPSPDRNLVLDLAEVRGIDSTGLAWLIRLCARTRNLDRQLLLAQLTPGLRRLFDSMQLDGFFECIDNLDAVLMKSPRPPAPECGAAVLLEPGPRVRWQGEVTAVNVDRVWQETQAFLAASQTNVMTLDLNAVTFIDTSGLGLMVRTKKAAGERQVSLTISGLRPAVLNVVRLARLESYLLQNDHFPKDARTPLVRAG